MGFGPRWREGSRTHLEKKFWEGRANSHLARRQGRSQRRGKRGEWSVRVLGRWRWRVEHWNSGTRSTEQLGWHRLIGVWCSVHDNLQSDRGGGCTVMVSRVLAPFPGVCGFQIPEFQNAELPYPPEPPFRPQCSRVPSRRPGTNQWQSRFELSGTENLEPLSSHPRCPPTRSLTHPPPPRLPRWLHSSGQWWVVRWSDRFTLRNCKGTSASASPAPCRLGINHLQIRRY